MESTKHIGLRVPAPILERVDALIGQLGVDRTAVILALLRQTLAMPGSVEQQLYDVQQQLTAVQQALLDVQQRLTTVEQRREDRLQPPSEESAVRSDFKRPVASPAPWQTLIALGKTYKFDSTNASRDAKTRGETMLQFLQRKTGLEWETDGGDRRPLYRQRQGNR